MIKYTHSSSNRNQNDKMYSTRYNIMVVRNIKVIINIQKAFFYYFFKLVEGQNEKFSIKKKTKKNRRAL